MKISFSTLGCPEWSFKEIISTAKDLGYDGIEVRGVKNVIYAPMIKEFAQNEAKNTMAQLKGLGVALVCLTSSAYLHDKANGARMRSEAYDYINLAKSLGVPYVRVLGDTNPAPSQGIDDAFVRDNLENVARYGAAAGVTPLIETNGVYADTSRLARLIEGVENVGVVWDIHHSARYFGESPEESYANIGPRVKHVHLKDSKMVDGALRYQMLSYGDIPVRECVDTLEKHGYKGYYSLEWVRRWDLSLEEAGIAFAHYASFMRSL